MLDTFHLVYEEKYISKYNLDPLLVVGTEGVFGLLVISSLQIPMYYIHTQTFQLGYNPTGRMVDPTGCTDSFYHFKLICCFCSRRAGPGEKLPAAAHITSRQDVQPRDLKLCRGFNHQTPELHY